jgi:hypothetical protein
MYVCMRAVACPTCDANSNVGPLPCATVVLSAEKWFYSAHGAGRGGRQACCRVVAV